MIQVCAFWLDEALYGVDVGNVQEIVRDLTLTPVPLAQREVRGLINLRGRVVTVVELRLCLDRPPKQLERPVYVVIDLGEVTFALAVDRMEGVVDYDPTRTERLMDQKDRNGLISGVFEAGERLIRVIDLGKLLERLERRRELAA